MKKTKTLNIAQQPMEFITTVSSTHQPSFEAHNEQAEAIVQKKVGQIKDNYQVVVRQLAFIIGDTDSQVKGTGFSLDEIKISLGFNAKGKLGFIAEAGVEASVEVSFKRK